MKRARNAKTWATFAYFSRRAAAAPPVDREDVAALVELLAPGGVDRLAISRAPVPAQGGA
jgi:hypothetical protein